MYNYIITESKGIERSIYEEIFLSFLFIATAAILWGLIGIAVKKLYYFGLDSLQIVSIRAVNSCIILVLLATLIGITLFREAVTISKVFGILLVIVAIVILSRRQDKDYEEETEENLNIEIN